MPLNPTFSVTPMNPRFYSYDSENQLFNCYANLDCFNTFCGSWSNFRLEDMCNEDKVILCYNPIDSPAPITLPPQMHKYNCVWLSFKTNATTENQYLLIFHVKGYGSIKAAFYLNGNFLRSEEVVGDETIAILVDCPEPNTWWGIYMFLEGFYGILEFKGIECYIL